MHGRASAVSTAQLFRTAGAPVWPGQQAFNDNLSAQLWRKDRDEREYRDRDPRRGLFLAHARTHAPPRRSHLHPRRLHRRAEREPYRRPDLGEEVVGSGYRSEIFYISDEQRQVAEDAIADASGFWGAKVATKISQAGTFWAAEPDDQDYLQRYTDGDNQFTPYRHRMTARASATFRN